MFGSMIGISIGCLLGLLPLWFMDDEETRSYKKTFASIDVDGSGQISFCELENALHGMGISLSRAALLAIYEEIDSDRDRKLDFAEFRQLCERWKQEHTR